MSGPENPPAFPEVPGDFNAYEGRAGMTILDWFAGQALTGFLADSSQRLVAEAIASDENAHLIDGPAAMASVVNEQIAMGCYALASAMLAARAHAMQEGGSDA